MDIYKEILLEHYRHPKNYGTLEHYDFATEQLNPSCGDAIALQGVVKDDQLALVRFTGHGCVISQAAASMLTQKVQGMSLDAIMQLDAEFMQTLLGSSLGPLRLKCALLALTALQRGVQSYQDTHAK